jgi:hypothetical protein
VRLDGGLADEEPRTYFSVRQSRADQSQHLQLAIAYRLRPPLQVFVHRRRSLDKPFDNAACNRRSKQRLPGRNDPDSCRKLARRNVLENETTGSSPQRRIDRFVVVECRED